MLRLSDVEHPALYISRALGVGVALSVDDLARLRMALLRRGFLDHLELFSVSGDAYLVTRAAYSAPLIAKLLPLRVPVEIELERRPAVDHLVLAERVVESLARDPEDLEEWTGHSVDWWTAEMRSAQSVPDLVMRFVRGIG
jgi:hypothetical protein